MSLQHGCDAHLHRNTLLYNRLTLRFYFNFMTKLTPPLMLRLAESAKLALS